MSNVVGMDGKEVVESHEDRYYFIFKFLDGEVKAWKGDYLAHDMQYAPNMVILSGPEATQTPVATINAESMKYVTYMPSNQVVEIDGAVEYVDNQYLEIDEKIRKDEGYV